MIAEVTVSDETDRSHAGHEQVVAFSDHRTGLSGTIAIHSTALGPGLGGTRARVYASHAEALTDVLLLSEAMTLKAAAAGLDLGGAKAVIELDPGEVLDDEKLERYGQIIDSLDGRYITAEDIGVGQSEIDVVARTTRHAVGTTSGVGDPSPWTARGVKAAMQGALQAAQGRVDWGQRTVTVVGVGKVGGALALDLAEAGATVMVADVDVASAERLAEHPRIDTVDLVGAHRTPCDVLAPCALGGYVSLDRVRDLACDFVIGAANNQLADDRVADALAADDIVYVPDFIANAGGLICVDIERRGDDPAELPDRIIDLGTAVEHLVTDAVQRSVSPLTAAVDKARQRIDAATR